RRRSLGSIGGELTAGLLRERRPRLMRLLAVCVLAALPAAAQHSLLMPPPVPLMPWPSQVEMGAGSLRIGIDFSISLGGDGANDTRIKAAVIRTISRLARQTGL